MHDELFWMLLFLAAAALFLSTPFIAWSARNRAGRAEARIDALEARIRLLEGAGHAKSAAPAEEAEVVDAAEPERAIDLVAPALEAEPVTAMAAIPAPDPVAKPDVESRLAQRWLVWLGAVAIGLGGLFMAAWAVEQGMLGPTARLAVATLLGFGLLGVAERARRRPPVSGMTDFVPSALASGGLVTLYGATLGAHLLYELISAPIALALLALVSALGVVLSLLFLPLLAVLGAIGAYLAPILVKSSEPAAWPLFLYLTAVVAGLALVAGLRRWGWLVVLILVGSGFWCWLAILRFDQPAATAFHLLAMGLASLALLASTVGEERPWLPLDLGLAWMARALLLVTSLLTLMILAASGHATAAVAELVALSLAGLVLAARIGRERWVVALLALADLAAAATWQIPAEVIDRLSYDPFIGLEPAVWIAPQASPLAISLLVIAASYAAAGFLLARRGRWSGFWATVSAFVPLLALATAYWRLQGLTVSPGYASIAMALAVLSTFAAERMARAELPTALAAYAMGAIAGVTLALTMTLEEAWLTVSIAVQLPAIGWLTLRLGLPTLRRPAMAVALLVLARLLWQITFDGMPSGLWYSLYAYGLPGLAFAAAAILFARQSPGPLVDLLQTGAVLFWLLTITGILRDLTGTTSQRNLLSLRFLVPSMLSWLLSAIALGRLAESARAGSVRGGSVRGGLVIWILSLILAAGGLFQLLVLVLPLNPVFAGDPVGGWPILNLLVPAYLAPAAIGVWLMRRARDPRVAMAAGGLALGLVWLWLTLEVRRFWQGSILTGSTSDGEWLAWSVAWLALAGALLLAGITRRDRPLRAAALGVGALAIAKAFLFDMAELQGLYRAASFMALGLCLVGVGWLYQHYVVADRPKAT